MRSFATSLSFLMYICKRHEHICEFEVRWTHIRNIYFRFVLLACWLSCIENVCEICIYFFRLFQLRLKNLGVKFNHFAKSMPEVVDGAKAHVNSFQEFKHSGQYFLSFAIFFFSPKKNIILFLN